MGIKVSVITATYNFGQFIEEAVESVLNQTFQNFEYIIIDDGSTDDTSKKVQKYHERIRYIYHENQGQHNAFNTAISLAQGEYVAFLDSDDKWRPDFLKKSVFFLDNNPAALVFCDFSSFDEQGTWRESFFKNIPCIQNYAPIKEFIFENCLDELIQQYFIFPSCVVVKRSVFDQLRFEPVEGCVQNNAGDYDFFIRVASLYKIGLINEVLTDKRDHLNNSSSNFRHSMSNQAIAMSRLLANPHLNLRASMLAKKRMANAYYNWAYGEFKKKNFNYSIKYAWLSLKLFLSLRALKTWTYSLLLSFFFKRSNK